MKRGALPPSQGTSICPCVLCSCWREAIEGQTVLLPGAENLLSAWAWEKMWNWTSPQFNLQSNNLLNSREIWNWPRMWNCLPALQWIGATVKKTEGPCYLLWWMLPPDECLLWCRVLSLQIKLRGWDSHVSPKGGSGEQRRHFPFISQLVVTEELPLGK